MFSLARLPRPALLIAALLAPLQANAVVINVNGTDYDVLFFTNGFNVGQPSFDDNAATLTNTATAPWWGNLALAGEFATAYEAQAPAGSFDVAIGLDILFFAAVPEVAANVRGAYVNSVGEVFLSNYTAESFNYTQVVYAYVPAGPAAVPEIDGNALPKALFLLFTLYVWLQIRRNRRAG